MTDMARLRREIDAMVDYVRSAEPIDPAEPVMVAGDPERRTKAERLKSGIPLDPEAWKGLTEFAAVAKVSLPPTT